MEKYNFQPLTTVDIHTNIVEEANKRYSEKIKVTRPKPVYDSRKLELLEQMDSQYELALTSCGFDFIKRICSIDQKLAHNILSIFSQAVENDNFDDVEMCFRKLIAMNLEEEKKPNKYR